MGVGMIHKAGRCVVDYFMIGKVLLQNPPG